MALAPPLSNSLLERLQCPNCNSALVIEEILAVCSSCGVPYPIESGIPILIPPAPFPEGFDYLTHYKRDSEQFDYFEARSGATEHSERRLREYILSLIPKDATSILDVGCGSAWVA